MWVTVFFLNALAFFCREAREILIVIVRVVPD